MDKLVVNLSDKHFTKDQLSVLSKGLNFCPVPKEPKPGDLRTDLDRLHRRLRLHSFFKDDEELEITEGGNLYSLSEFKHLKFKPASKFNPVGPAGLESMITLNEFEFNNRPNYEPAFFDNLNKGERIALNELKTMKDVIFKSADKGRSVVIQSRTQYLDEGYRQLSDTKFYTKQTLDLTEKHRLEIESFLFSMLNNQEIDISVYDYLTQKECRTSVLYLLPKIHKGKTPCPGRPIVSAINSPTEKISQFVDHFLNPCAFRVKSYLKDTTHFLTTLDQVGDLPENSWLVTLDVVQLYPNISNGKGILAAKEALEELRPNPNYKPQNSTLI